MSAARKAIGVLKRYGVAGFFNKAMEKLRAPDRHYDQVKEKFYPTQAELDQQHIAERRLRKRPLLSVVVPSYQPREIFLRELIASLIAQTYENWELVIADASDGDVAKNCVEGAKDQRVRLLSLEKNEGISGNTNAAIAAAKGDYIGFLDYDDLLTPNALFEVASRLEKESFDLFYSDEDKISERGDVAFQPHLKSDYNHMLLLSNNYICHFMVLSRTLIETLTEPDGQVLRSAYDGSQDYDLVLRAVEKTDRICHIPKVLYHWRESAGSTAGDSYSKTYTEDAGKRAVEAHLARLGIASEVKNRLEIGCYRIDPIPEKGVGVIGVKTVCHGKVDSCGLYYDGEGGVRHCFSGLPASFKGYCRRAVLQQEVSGVLLAYAKVLPEAEAVCGKPDETLPEPYRSMAYCERIRHAGFSVVIDPNEVVEIKEPSPEGKGMREGFAGRDPFFAGVQKIGKMI